MPAKKNPRKAVLAQGIVVEGVDPKLQKRDKGYHRPSKKELLDEALAEIDEDLFDFFDCDDLGRRVPA